MSQFPVSDSAGGSSNPFAASPPAGPPPRKSRVWMWVLLGAGGAGVLVCCGCAGFGMVGWRLSTGVLGTELVQQLNNDAVSKQEIGTATSATLDVMASGEASQKADGKSVLVFHVIGDKGSGEVRAEQGGGKGNMFRNAKLILPDGKEVQLGF